MERLTYNILSSNERRSGSEPGEEHTFLYAFLYALPQIWWTSPFREL
jgi:hypothetical protein